MALSASSVFELRTTGSDSNGGGFVTGASGTDYSQQAAAQYALTGLTTSAANAIILSASAAADMVGNLINITGGTNFTTGVYQITAVSVGVSITVDRNCTTAAGAAGVGNVGGALLTPGFTSSIMVAGSTTHQKSGTYTVTSATANVIAGCVSIPAGTAASAATRWIGYGTTRNDNGTKPIIISDGTITTFTLFTLANLCECRNVEVDGNSRTSSRGFLLAASSRTYLCKADRCTNSGFAGVAGSTAVLCQATTCSTQPAFSALACLLCVSNANTVTGFSGVLSAIHCVSISNTGASSNGFVESGGSARYFGCISCGNGQHGFSNTSPGTGAIWGLANCLASENVAYNFHISVAHDGCYMHNCAGYNTGTANNLNFSSGNIFNFVTLTVDPFTNKAGLDFSLNNTAGGGALCRAAGIPGATSTTQLPGLSTLGYPDIGGAQHADPSIPVGQCCQ